MEEIEVQNSNPADEINVALTEKKRKKSHEKKKKKHLESNAEDLTQQVQPVMNGTGSTNEMDGMDAAELELGEGEKKKKKNKKRKADMNTEQDEVKQEESELAADKNHEILDGGGDVSDKLEKKKSKKIKFSIERLEGATVNVSGIMSSVSFETLKLSEPTLNAIRDTGFENMTEVSLF